MRKSRFIEKQIVDLLKEAEAGRKVADKAKSGAENGIESVRTNSPKDARYERKESSSGQPFFVLKAANGEPIGRSE